MRGDAPYYHCLAKSILRGQYQISFEDISDEAIKRRKEVLDAKIFFHTAVIDQPTNYWSPGYPLFLAGLYALFGIHFWIPALLGCIIGVLCCYMLWLIASRLVNPTAGLISAAPWAIHPIAVTKSPELESETLGLLLLLVSVYLFLLWRDREGNLGPIKALLLGVMLGMPFYVRSTSGLLVPIFAITLLLNPSWKRLATALLLCSSFILILIPWGIRNQRSLGKFMVFETRGVNVMLGEISRKGYHPPRKNEFKAETELEAWKAQKLILLNTLQADPAILLRVGWYHLRSWLFPYGKFAELRTLFNWLFAAGVGLGIFLTRKNWQNTIPLCLFMALYTITILFLMKGDEARFRLPVEAMALPFLSVALIEFYNWTVKRLNPIISKPKSGNKP